MFRLRVGPLITTIAAILVLTLPAVCQQRNQVPFTAALEIAGQVTTRVASQAAIPETYRISLADDQAITISITQALGLLAEPTDAAGKGTTPPLPLLPDTIGTPIAIAGSAQNGTFLIPADSLYAECRPFLNFTTSLGGFPSAVWVSAKKLSAVEFMVALASMLQYAAESGKLPDNVRVVSIRPPTAWKIAPEKRTTPQIPALPGPTPEAPKPIFSGPVKIDLMPGNGARLTGQIDFVAGVSLAPSDVTVTFLLDGKMKCASNLPPYALHLNVDELLPGKHTVTVRVEGGERRVSASKDFTFVANEPKPIKTTLTKAIPTTSPTKKPVSDTKTSPKRQPK